VLELQQPSVASWRAELGAVNRRRASKWNLRQPTRSRLLTAWFRCRSKARSRFRSGALPLTSQCAEHNLQSNMSGTIGPSSSSRAWCPGAPPERPYSRLLQRSLLPRRSPTVYQTCLPGPSRLLARLHRLPARRGLAEASSRSSLTRFTLTWTRLTCCTACAWPACPWEATSRRLCRITRTCALTATPLSTACTTLALHNACLLTQPTCSYGPFWIAATLVFLSSATGNLASYYAYRGTGAWTYDIQKVTLSALLFYGYITVVPLVVRARASCA